MSSLVLCLKADGGVNDRSRRADHHGLAVSTGHAVALRSGGHNDELEVGGDCRRVRPPESELVDREREVGLAGTSTSTCTGGNGLKVS